MLFPDETPNPPGPTPTTQVLKYLHEGIGVVHCDLKPENLLCMSNGQIKVQHTDGWQNARIQNICAWANCGICIPTSLLYVSNDQSNPKSTKMKGRPSPLIASRMLLQERRWSIHVSAQKDSTV